MNGVGVLLKTHAADLFELDPSGYGCTCRKCHRHFTKTKDWHLHIGRCAPEFASKSEPEPAPEAPTQLEISDWRSR